MACSAYNTSSSQTIYIYSDNTNYNPSSPTTSQSTNYNVLSVKNHILLGFEPAGLPEMDQPIEMNTGWGWWSTYVDITLEQLEEALGSNCASITSQDGGFVSYINGLGWTGEINGFTPAKMYKLQIAEGVSVSVTGTMIDPALCTITLNPGDNWIGYPVSQSMSLTEAFADANPVNGDKVSAYDGYAQYYNGTWYGELQTLQPGQGYIYKSNATSTKTFTFPFVSK